MNQKKLRELEKWNSKNFFKCKKTKDVIFKIINGKRNYKIFNNSNFSLTIYFKIKRKVKEHIEILSVNNNFFFLDKDCKIHIKIILNFQLI